MTSYEIDQTVTALAGLFPKSEWTEALYGLFRARAMKYEISAEQGIAIVNEYRMNTRNRSPSIMVLMARIKEAAHAGAKRERQEPAADGPRPPAEFIRDIEHPGVLVRDPKTGKDMVVSWEKYGPANQFELTPFRKKHPTPWESKPYERQPTP